MSGTTPGSYLVIARYGPANWAKWKNTPLDRKLDARAVPGPCDHRLIGRFRVSRDGPIVVA